MAIRKIVRYPDPLLKQVCAPVTWPAGDELAELVRDMAETMYASEGAGLASIQVGTAVRLYIVDPEVAGRDPTDAPVIFINPEIIWKSDQTEVGDEGCLSFPGIFVPVERALRCKTRAYDMQGQLFEIEGSGLLARAMQHEQDHLDGRLLADYVGRLKRKMIERRLEREAPTEGAAP